MKLSPHEIDDLLKAIEDAQDELCVDYEGNRFPEGTAYDRRLTAIAERLKAERDEQDEPCPRITGTVHLKPGTLIVCKLPDGVGE